MYIKFHCNTNWKIIPSPTPTPALLSGTSFISSSLHGPSVSVVSWL